MLGCWIWSTGSNIEVKGTTYTLEKPKPASLNSKCKTGSLNLSFHGLETVALTCPVSAARMEFGDGDLQSSLRAS